MKNSNTSDKSYGVSNINSPEIIHRYNATLGDALTQLKQENSFTYKK